MSVSVILVTWNALDRTRRCLAGLRASGVPLEAVIAVDNGSSDGTAAFLRSSGVRVVENRENRGFARAANQGIRAAPASHDLLLLNNDVQPGAPGWLDRLAACLRDDPRAAAVSARLVNPDGRLQDAGLRLAWDPLCIRPYGGGENDVGQFGRTREVPAVSFACALLRRAAVEAVGLLDEDYFCFFEDVDWCLRASRSGWRILCCGEVTVAHEGNATVSANRLDRASLFDAARRVFDRKWPRSPRTPRGDVVALAYPSPDAGSVAAIGRILLGLEDLGWRVNLRGRFSWGSPLDRIDAADDWGSFFRAQRYRVPGEPARALVLGSPLGVALEGSPSTCAVIAFAQLERFRPAHLAGRFSWAAVPREFQRRRLAGMSEVDLVAPPVDPDYFFPRPSRRGEAATILVIGPATALSGAVGRAFARAFAGSRAVRLRRVVCGPEPPRTEEAELDAEWSPWPQAAERAAWFSEADAVIEIEGPGGWGLFAREAEACGRPAEVIPASAAAPDTEARLAAELRGLLGAPSAGSPPAAGGGDSLERISRALELFGRPEPERFPAGANPIRGPLCDSPRNPELPGVTAGEVAAAQAAAALLELLHLRATHETLLAERTRTGERDTRGWGALLARARRRILSRGS